MRAQGKHEEDDHTELISLCYLECRGNLQRLHEDVHDPEQEHGPGLEIGNGKADYALHGVDYCKFVQARGKGLPCSTSSVSGALGRLTPKSYTAKEFIWPRIVGCILFAWTDIGMITWIILFYTSHRNTLFKTRCSQRGSGGKQQQHAGKHTKHTSVHVQKVQIAETMDQAIQALLQQSQQTSAQFQELARALQLSTSSGSQAANELATAVATYSGGQRHIEAITEAQDATSAGVFTSHSLLALDVK